MRIFRGLENIHSVIDKHQAEWLREQGEELERPERISVEERIRRSFAETNGTGKFSADRFMGGHVHEKLQSESHDEPSVEVVKIIPSGDENHSWLYNEVLKAINDAVGDRKNTKVIAIFVPVVQNGKEFENLPVDKTVTISTDDDELPDEIPEPEPLPEPLPLIEIADPAINPEEPEESSEKIEIKSAPAPELPAMGEDFNLLPEGFSEPDAELAEAFQTIEENLDDNLNESDTDSDSELELESEQEFHDEPVKLPDAVEATEENTESEDVMTISEGEPLSYEEIELPEPLDDDDIVFDDSVFGDNLSGDDKHNDSEDSEESDMETIIIEDKENESSNESVNKSANKSANKNKHE